MLCAEQNESILHTLFNSHINPTQSGNEGDVEHKSNMH